MLYTASFYAPDNWEGMRYRVSRSHPRGRRTQWDTLPFLYPARDLLVAYRAGELDFAGLSAEYRSSLDLRHHESAELQEWLSKVQDLGDFTLLCFEREGQPCHRLVLAEWLLGQTPGLVLGRIR
ncbi:MAG: DUF488 family protein [Stenotrophomonas maltophilia]